MPTTLKKYMVPLAIKRQPQSKPREEQKVSPIKLELLITIVEKKKADFYADLIQSFDSNVQIKVLARGAASSEVLDYFGLTSTGKIVLFSMIRGDRRNEIMDTLEEKFRTIKKGRGVAVAVPFTSVIGKQVFGFLANDDRLIKEE